MRHLIRCFCRFRAERFVGRLHRLGVNASIGGRWVTDEIGCRFVDTTHPAVR